MPDTTLRAAPVGAMDHLWRWQLNAACRGRPELFFHPPGERDPQWTQRENAAKQLCASCPVQDECADFALVSEEPYGTWGGMTAREREKTLRGPRRTGQRQQVRATTAGPDERVPRTTGLDLDRQVA